MAADRSSVDRTREKLDWASQPRANLTGEALSGDDFLSAILIHVELRYAILPGATGYVTHLTGAIMSHAELLGADLTGAILQNLGASPSFVKGYDPKCDALGP